MKKQRQGQYGAQVTSYSTGQEMKYIILFECQDLLEWDKLSQNPFLAFYQRWPWLCPKYSIYQSLETISRSCELHFYFCIFECLDHFDLISANS